VENLCQCHFVRNKCHADWPGIEAHPQATGQRHIWLIGIRRREVKQMAVLRKNGLRFETRWRHAAKTVSGYRRQAAGYLHITWPQWATVRCLSSTTSATIILKLFGSPWRWKRQVSPKQHYTRTKLRAITFKRAGVSRLLRKSRTLHFDTTNHNGHRALPPGTFKRSKEFAPR
jgi:hypothetical protein